MGYPHPGKNGTELPYSQVRDLFAKTARTLGLSEMFSNVFGQSVWHLCNRGYDGVSNSLLFLTINQDSLRQVWGNPDYPFVNDELSLICPIRTAVIVDREIEDARRNGSLGEFGLVIGRSALPMLSLPFLARSLRGQHSEFDAIKLSGPTATICMSDGGMCETAETLAHEFAWVGNKDDVTKPVRYSLCRTGDCDDGLYYQKRRHETLWVPTNRLVSDGTLRL